MVSWDRLSDELDSVCSISSNITRPNASAAAINTDQF